MDLWNNNVEINFFKKGLSDFASADKLFYKDKDGNYLAYWPKKYKGKKSTNQSRNSLIGNYTEKWSRDLIAEVVEPQGLYAIQGAVCDELALPNYSIFKEN